MYGPTTYDIASDWIGDPYQNGDSPGLVATSRWSTGVQTDDGQVGGNNTPSKAAAAPTGDWLTGFLTLAFFVVVIMVIVARFGKPEDDFKKPNASLYTMLISALSAVALIPIFKLGTAALANTNLPLTAGLNTYVQAS